MIQFDQLWSTLLVSFDQLWSTMIKCDHLGSTIINFDQLWSTMISVDHLWSTLISFAQLWSTVFNQLGAKCECFKSWCKVMQMFLVLGQRANVYSLGAKCVVLVQSANVSSEWNWECSSACKEMQMFIVLVQSANVSILGEKCKCF